jgi:hypothetical protein
MRRHAKRAALRSPSVARALAVLPASHRQHSHATLRSSEVT